MQSPDLSGWMSLLAAVESRKPPMDFTPLRQAQELLLSKGQTDHGELSHPALAQILNQLGMDAETLAAGVLLPWVEGGEIELGTVEKAIGPGVVRLLKGATRIAAFKEFHKHDATPDQVNRIRKMLLTMAEDPRVVLLRLADQVDRLRRFKDLSEGARRGLAQET